MLRKRASLIVAVVAAVMAATAVAGAFGSSGASDTVAIRANNDYTNFDFQVNTAGLMWYVGGGYDRLVALSNGKVVPYLASSWKATPKKVTFQLRRGAKCANGNQITPNVVVKSFQRLFTAPKNGLNLPGDFGPGPYSVTGDMKKWTVTISTQTGYRGILIGTAQDDSGIVCPAGLANPELLKTQLLGSGPYGLVSAKHGDQVVLKLRKDWNWGPVINGKRVTAKDLPDTQVWKIIPNETTAANLLLTGGLDIGRVSGPDKDRVKASGSFNNITAKLSWPGGVAFRIAPGHATADKTLRQAIMMSINPKDWAQAAFGSDGTVVTSFIPPGIECSDPKAKSLYPTYSIDKAKQLLTQAGYKNVGSDGKLQAPDGKPVKLTILMSSSLIDKAPDYTFNQVRQLGADLTLVTNDSGVRAFTGNFDLAAPYVVATAPDVSAGAISYFGGKTVPQGGLNLFGPSAQDDPKWAALLRGGFKNTGPLGCVYWKKAQEYALTEGIYMPIVQGNVQLFDHKPWTHSLGARFIEPVLIHKQ